MIETALVYLPNNFIGLTLLGLAFILGLTLIFYVKKSEWIIYLLLVWFPFESLVLMYTPIRYFSYVKYIPEIIMYGLVIASFISFIRRKKKILSRQPLNKWIIGFVVISFISLLFNWYSPVVWTLGMRQILRFVLLLFVIVWMEYDEKVLKHIMIWGISMIGLEAILGLVQYASNGRLDQYLFSTRTVTVGNAAIVGGLEQFWTVGSRVFATMGRYDRLGSFIALGLIMAFPYAYHLKKNIHKVSFAILGLCSAFVLGLTYSRASWIACGVGVFVIGIILLKDKRVWIAFGVGFSVLALYLIGFAIAKDNLMSITEKPTQTIAERVVEAFSLKAWRESYEGFGRIFFIINTPRVVVWNYPFFGVGPGQYGGGAAAALINTDMYDRLHLPFGIQNTYGQIDNNWLSMWGEVGTIGLVIWIGLFVAIIRLSHDVWLRSQHEFDKLTALGLIGLTCGIMSMGFFGPYFEFRSLMFYYWTIVGIVALQWYRLKKVGNMLEGD
ncbi:MAG: O-antigen ligase family protein [Candidatus Magasanikbacteria bacterium]